MYSHQPGVAQEEGDQGVGEEEGAIRMSLGLVMLIPALLLFIYLFIIYVRTLAGVGVDIMSNHQSVNQRAT